MIHQTDVRIYYEDTDMAGIVYYANYLKYLERGRSDAVREQGLDQLAMRDRQGLVFAVRRVEINYLGPARFGDVLTVDTWTTRVAGATLEMGQRVRLDDRVLVRAHVTVACMTLSGRVTRYPANMRTILAAAVCDGPTPG